MNNWFEKFFAWERWRLLTSPGVGYPERDIRDFLYEVPYADRIDGLLLPRK